MQGAREEEREGLRKDSKSPGKGPGGTALEERSVSPSKEEQFLGSRETEAHPLMNSSKVQSTQRWGCSLALGARVL